MGCPALSHQGGDGVGTTGCALLCRTETLILPIKDINFISSFPLKTCHNGFSRLVHIKPSKKKQVLIQPCPPIPELKVLSLAMPMLGQP